MAFFVSLFIFKVSFHPFGRHNMFEQQLIFKAIIRRSIYLMKNTNMTIQQIACEFSFPNASSFGTFFKKHTGLSPKNYRMGAE